MQQQSLILSTVLDVCNSGKLQTAERRKPLAKIQMLHSRLSKERDFYRQHCAKRKPAGI